MIELVVSDMATKDEIQSLKEALGSPTLWRWFEDVANVMKPIIYALRDWA